MLGTCAAASRGRSNAVKHIAVENQSLEAATVGDPWSNQMGQGLGGNQGYSTPREHSKSKHWRLLMPRRQLRYTGHRLNQDRTNPWPQQRNIGNIELCGAHQYGKYADAESVEGIDIILCCSTRSFSGRGLHSRAQRYGYMNIVLIFW